MDKEKKIISALTYTKRKHADLLLNLSASTLNTLHKTKGENFWIKKGEAKALSLFHQMSKRVPAYKDFLKKNHIKARYIQNIKDFKRVPPVTKENYIQKYPSLALTWDGRGEGFLVAASSGTSGTPSLWRRGYYQEAEAAFMHELLYTSFFEVNKRKTLLVIGFPMGLYVSGIATALPSLNVAKKKQYLRIVTPGNKKDDFLKMIDGLHNEYDQLLFAGHPFFIKDVLEEGEKVRARWLNKRIRLFLCSEGFNETWREYIANKIKDKKDLRNIISVYGSSEFLLMGYETPFTIFLKKKLECNSFLRALFDIEREVPQIFQYNPLLRFFEEEKGELLVTAQSGIPLVRYNMHDSGTIYSFDSAQNILQNKTKQYQKKLQGVTRYSKWKLPLVLLFGRSDMSLVFYAANIYPEHIKQALDQKQFLSLLTGKFTMRKEYLKNMDQYWEINIELREGVSFSAKLQKHLRERLITTLKKVNMEYRFIWEHLDKDVRPRVTLWSHQSAPYFLQGVKPKYIIS